MSLLKARKVLQLKEREFTRNEKEELLTKLKQTMDLYSELMAQHSKSSLERDNPQGTYDHFNNKWRLQDPAFQELKIPDHLICPISKELFVDPVLLKDGTVFERTSIDNIWDEEAKSWKGN